MATLLEAGKYTDVRTAAGRTPALARGGPRTGAALGGFGETALPGKSLAGGDQVRKRPRGMNAARRSGAVGTPRPTSMNIVVPTRGGKFSWPAWFERELREGGMLHEYLRIEKATAERRLRAVARRAHGWKANPKSDWKLLAAVPGREYIRWAKEDPDFWLDDNNLRSLRRDNETMRSLIKL